jgi:hypothetical protein
VLLAELTIRHTRRHMPTRRVALGSAYLPMSGPAHGASLLSSVLAVNLPELSEEQVDLLPRLLDDATDGLTIPRIALWYRLQTDVHGLDRSRHRLLGENNHLVVELDTHGAPAPQVLGAVLAVASLPPTPRAAGLGAIRAVLDGRWPGLSPDVEVRRLDWIALHQRPPLPGVQWRAGSPPEERAWDGIPSERRWAMEVLGLRADMRVERDDVNRRYRRLLHDAHPDHGAAAKGAAERIAELSEARTLLLEFASAAQAAEG